MTLQQTNSHPTSVQGTDLSTRHVNNGNRLLAFQEFILLGYTPECWINCHEQASTCMRPRGCGVFSSRLPFRSRSPVLVDR